MPTRVGGLGLALTRLTRRVYGGQRFRCFPGGMPRTCTLTLGRNDLLQVTLGLEVRATQWAKTAEYLEQGDTDDPEFIPEDCTRPEEARRIAGQYQRILKQMEEQVEAQGGWTK